jgi:cytochrome c-type biogenesis protein CcmH/NrfG
VRERESERERERRESKAKVSDLLHVSGEILAVAVAAVSYISLLALFFV